jgi:hypothetical protein
MKINSYSDLEALEKQVLLRISMTKDGQLLEKIKNAKASYKEAMKLCFPTILERDKNGRMLPAKKPRIDKSSEIEPTSNNK